jgi:hydrogenase expression/formation protein HypE
MQAVPAGREAAVIGRVQAQPARVILETAIGGERVLEELEDDPLPRIC